MTLERARAEMAIIAARFEQAHPEANKDWKSRVEPLINVTVGDAGRPLWILFGAVSLVLLIACANLANLQLARASARQQEMTVRAALGASRGRIVRQLVAEGLILSCVGTGLALLLAWAGLTAFLALAGNAIPRSTEIRLDATVLGSPWSWLHSRESSLVLRRRGGPAGTRSRHRFKWRAVVAAAVSGDACDTG